MADTRRVDPIERAKQADAAARRDAAGANAREVNLPFDKFKRAIPYGLVGGLIVGIVQYLINLSGEGLQIGWEIVSFALLAPVLWVALRSLKAHYAAGEFYKNAAIFSMYISFFAAVVTVLIGVIAYGVSQTDAPESMSVEGFGFMQLLVNSVFQIVVGVVLGNLIAFIFMQGMKTDVVADEFVEKQQ